MLENRSVQTAPSRPTSEPVLATRRRLALLIHSLDGGGAERLMSQLANRWSQHHEIHLVTWSSSDSDRYPLDTQVLRHGLKLQQASRGIYSGIVANVRRIRSLRAKLQEISPDFILSFCDQMNILALEATRASPTIPIWIAEHSDPQQQRLGRLWEAWRTRNYYRCSGCVVLTHSIAQYMTRWIPAPRLRVIPPALAIMPDANQYLPMGPDEMGRFLFVGRLSPEKNLPLLLDSWRLAAESLPQWQLTVVGDGPQRSQLQEIARQIPRVHWVGWCDRPEDYFATCQCFVLSSHYEGFPVSLLEALSHGLPAITTNCTSALDQVLHHSDPPCLRVVPLATAQSLADAMIELAEHPARREALSLQSRLVAQQYLWERVGPLWDAILT